jgi:hypothetical protein
MLVARVPLVHMDGYLQLLTWAIYLHRSQGNFEEIRLKSRCVHAVTWLGQGTV